MKLVESTGNFDVKFKIQIYFSCMPIMTTSLRTRSESEKYYFVASPVHVHFCNFLVWVCQSLDYGLGTKSYEEQTSLLPFIHPCNYWQISFESSIFSKIMRWWMVFLLSFQGLGWACNVLSRTVWYWFAHWTSQIQKFSMKDSCERNSGVFLWNNILDHSHT